MLSALIKIYNANAAFLNRIPVLNRFPMAARRWQRKKWIASKENTRDVFTHIYENNLWNAESASGPGSTEDGTRVLRQELPRLVSDWKIQSILDAPCGDFHWFPKIQFEGPIHYIGGDIVTELIEKNRRSHSSPHREFRNLDILSDALPAADLWLCRDCWIHFSAEDIRKAVSNFLRSDIRFLLATNYPRCRKNASILTGEFRPINLTADPFFFPPPLFEIDDPLQGYPDKKLGLWSHEQLAHISPAA